MVQKRCGTQKEPVKLLWTGGWDSTFRLLQLSIYKRRITQPFYLIDPKRRSTKHEIQAMERIKGHLFAEHPGLQGYILPTKYAEVRDIPQNASITEAHRRVAGRSFIGEQYDWLSRWCAANGFRDIELCVHLDDEVHKAIERYVTRSSEDGDKGCRLDDNSAATDEFLLFRHFRFPLFDLSKRDMMHAARAHGLDNYMEMTWFCHNPSYGSSPCGICNPCRYAIEEGLAYRVPFFGRGKYQMQRFFIRTLKKRAPLLYLIGRTVARKIGWA